MEINMRLIQLLSICHILVVLYKSLAIMVIMVIIVVMVIIIYKHFVRCIYKYWLDSKKNYNLKGVGRGAGSDGGGV
jgi:hypothetical protein